MSHADPMILDTEMKVADANQMRAIVDRGGRTWRLGDSCWYDWPELIKVLPPLAKSIAERAVK